MFPKNQFIDSPFTISSFLKLLVTAWSLSAVRSNAELPKDTACGSALPKGGFKALTDFSYAYDLNTTNPKVSDTKWSGLTGQETPFAGTYQYLTRLLAHGEPGDLVREACGQSYQPIAYEIRFNNQPHFFPKINHTRFNVTAFDELFSNITLAELANSYPHAIALTTHVFTYIKRQLRNSHYIEVTKFFVSTVPLPVDLGETCYPRTESAWDFLDSAPFLSLNWLMEDHSFHPKRLLNIYAPLFFTTLFLFVIYCVSLKYFFPPKRISNPLERYLTAAQIEDALKKQADLNGLNLSPQNKKTLLDAGTTDAFKCAICYSLLGVNEPELELLFLTRSIWRPIDRLKLPYPLTIENYPNRYHPACLIRTFQHREINPGTGEPLGDSQLHVVPDFRQEITNYLGLTNSPAQ
jgi:hypothetical protein